MGKLSGKALLQAAKRAGYDVDSSDQEVGWGASNYREALGECYELDTDIYEIVPVGQSRAKTYCVMSNEVLLHNGTIGLEFLLDPVTSLGVKAYPRVATWQVLHIRKKELSRWACRHKREAKDKYCPVCAVMYFRFVSE